MASISKRTRGTRTFWEARVTIKGHPPLSKSFDTKTKASKWANEAEAKIRGGDRVSFQASKTTVAEALDEFLTAHTKTVTDEEGRVTEICSLPKSKRYAVGMVRHHLGDFSIEKLTRKLMTAFLKELLITTIPKPANKKKSHPLFNGDADRCYSPSAARKQFYALKTAIEWHAREHDYQLGDRFEGVEVPAAWSQPRQRRLEVGEEERLLKACEAMLKDPRGWQLLIRLALETAMRAGELTQMQWTEVNLSKRFLVIPKEREKTRVGRQVPLSSAALTIFKELQDRRAAGDERVFARLPQSTSLLGVGFKRITKRAKCEDLRFHDLRHEAVSRFFESTSLQAMEIAMITGHTELKTLQRYAVLRPSLLAEKLDGVR